MSFPALIFPATAGEAAQVEPLFHARGLTKVYHMGDVDVHALQGVDLDLHAGEFVVILGPSGSGKSTLLNILGGLDAPTSGAVRFRDHDLVGAGERELTRYRREHVGFVFQFYNLIPSLTALENVALVTDIAERPMSPSEALDLVGLTDRAHHFPAQLVRWRAATRRDRARHRQASRRPALRRTHGSTRRGNRKDRARGANDREHRPWHDHGRDHA